MSSTGTPDAVKVACPVWMRGKSVSSYLCIQGRETLPIRTTQSHALPFYVFGGLLLAGAVAVVVLLRGSKGVERSDG